LLTGSNRSASIGHSDPEGKLAYPRARHRLASYVFGIPKCPLTS
jgi:hypothetical protein